MKLATVVFTECSPDGLLALYILHKRGVLKGATIVVSEGDATMLQYEAALLSK